MLLSITIVSAVIAFIEGIPLVKKKMWKEFVTLMFILLIAILLVVEKLFDIPTPVNILNNLLSPFGKIIFKSN
jgi:hypothetical protein